MILAHKHCVVGHHLEGPAGERRAAEEGAASVDALVILGDQDVDVLDTEVRGGVDVRGVVLELAVQDGCVAHQAALDRLRANNLLDQVVVRLHDDDVGVDEPDPFGGGVERECFSDSRDLGPGLLGMSMLPSLVVCKVLRLTLCASPIS